MNLKWKLWYKINIYNTWLETVKEYNPSALSFPVGFFAENNIIYCDHTDIYIDIIQKTDEYAILKKYIGQPYTKIDYLK